MRRVATLSLCAVLLMGWARSVWADVAPPNYPQGDTLNPGSSVTSVQMLEEEVLLVVRAADEPITEYGNLTADTTVGHVEARFVMRNRGDAEESFDVQFPLGAPSSFGEVNQIANFAAWVDDVPASVVEQMLPGALPETLIPWATWSVTFPPGQDVTIRVSYDVLPVGYRPYGTFDYIVETGAGWWGPIGEGTITFRLPYAVNSTNTVLAPDSAWDTAPRPEGFTISATDVVWQFSDLEPTAEDNVRLTVMAIPAWEEIVAARAQAAAQPDSVEAQLRLARALSGGVQIRYGLVEIGDGLELAASAEAAYRRALELTPDEVDHYVEYLEWMRAVSAPMGPLPADFQPTLLRALELAPDDSRLLEMQTWSSGLLPTATPTPAASPTAQPLSTPSPTPTLRPSPTPIRLSIPTPRPLSTAAPSPVPAQRDEGGHCPGAMATTLGFSGLALMASWKSRHFRR